MKKIVSLFSFLFFITLGVNHTWALPPCPSDKNATWDNCLGTWEWDNGTKYIGEWKNNKKDGQGTITYDDGDKYVGEFKDETYNGQGTYYYLADNEFKGDKYVGEFKDGKFDGQGTYTYADGDKYVGEFSDNKRSGQGTYTFVSGRKGEGEWKDGKPNGYFIYYNADGSIDREGIFKDDEFLYAETREKKEPSKIDKYKSTCEEIGFTLGTEKFGDCVMKLMDKD